MLFLTLGAYVILKPEHLVIGTWLMDVYGVKYPMVITRVEGEVFYFCRLLGTFHHNWTIVEFNINYKLVAIIVPSSLHKELV